MSYAMASFYVGLETQVLVDIVLLAHPRVAPHSFVLYICRHTLQYSD